MSDVERGSSRSTALGCVSLVALTGLLGAGCTTTPSAHTATATATSTSRPSPVASLSPVGARGTGSTIALAMLQGRTVALLADEDEQSVDVVDLERGELVGRADVGGKPGQLLVLSDGRVLVTVTDKDRLAVLSFSGAPSRGEGAVLRLENAVETDVEPSGLAATPDESTVLVASRTGRTLGSYSAKTMTRVAQVETARDPFAVTTSTDGSTAFVSHVAGGHLTAVSLRDMTTVRDFDVRSEPDAAERRQQRRLHLAGVVIDDTESRRKSAQGFTISRSDALGRVFAPVVLVDPGSAGSRSGGYGSGSAQSEVSAVAVLDAQTATVFGSSLELRRTDLGWGGLGLAGGRRPPCLLPRASAVDDANGTLLVACAGIDSVVAYELASVAPATAEVWRAHVASGPEGLAIDAVHGRLVVWSSFDRVLSTLPLAPSRVPADETTLEPRASQFVVPASPARALPKEVALGRLLFNSSNDSRVAIDGRGCASCHPSGRDDGLVWSTPRGPRRTRVLAGMLTGTAPYSWDGFTPDLPAHVEQVFERLRGQGGLRPFERRALLRYIESLPLPPAPRSEALQVARGRAVFASAEAACSGCHKDARHTDGAMHDVSSRTPADLSKAFDTPSLRRVGNRAPYFHDGRYPTLEALIAGVDGTMGKTKHLSAEEQRALVAYLRSL